MRRRPRRAPQTDRTPGRSRRAAPRGDGDRGEDYRAHVAAHLESGDAEHGLREAIGGNFDTMGLIQRDLLIAHGLRPDGSVVDVGCGSGRLALPLSQYLGPDGRYLGTDVVPALVDYYATSSTGPTGASRSSGGCGSPRRASPPTLCASSAS